MNTVHKVRWLLVAGLCLAAIRSNAQNIFRFTFTGTASATNSAGKFVTQKVTEKTWLQDFLASNSITNNPRHLMVVYHVNGDSHGDTVDIVDTKTKATLYTIWGLFFSSEFGRLPMVSSDGLQQKRIDYIYGPTESVRLDRAEVLRTAAVGHMDHWPLIIEIAL